MGVGGNSAGASEMAIVAVGAGVVVGVNVMTCPHPTMPIVLRDKTQSLSINDAPSLG